jgi:hypothetical protein
MMSFVTVMATAMMLLAYRVLNISSVLNTNSVPSCLLIYFLVSMPAPYNQAAIPLNYTPLESYH